MNRDRIAQNLAAVQNHFQSETLNEVEAALETFTDDILWKTPALNGLTSSFSVVGLATLSVSGRIGWLTGILHLNNVAPSVGL